MPAGVYLIVRAVDKVNANDVALDAMCTKRGDVVDMLPGEWTPRPGEQAMIDAGAWVPVFVVGATMDDLSAFMVPDEGDQVAGILPRRRAFGLDIAQWIAQGRPVLPLAAVMALKGLKPRLRDPHVIG
jgi:hypothetical protein